jgi:uncharacterized membrane protein YwaF
MIDFFRKFIFDGFVHGDYTMGTVHILSLVFCGVSIIVFTLLLRNKDSKYVHNKMKIIAYFAIIIYLLRRGVRVIEGETFLEAFWPFYLCNVNTILLSIWIIFDLKRGKDFMIITGISGAVLAFIIPDGIFVDKYLTLNILDSVFSHYEIVAIPVILMLTKAYQLDIKRMPSVIIGLLLVYVNVEILQPILIGETVDYLFLDGNLPFVIEGVNQFFIMFASAIVYTLIIYFLDYLYLGKINLFKIVNKKQKEAIK